MAAEASGKTGAIDRSSGEVSFFMDWITTGSAGVDNASDLLRKMDKQIITAGIVSKI